MSKVMTDEEIKFQLIVQTIQSFANDLFLELSNEEWERFCRFNRCRVTGRCLIEIVLGEQGDLPFKGKRAREIEALTRKYGDNPSVNMRKVLKISKTMWKELQKYES